MRTQLWLWFIGMIVTTFPWHWVGILGMPRRMAYFDYADPALAPQAFSVVALRDRRPHPADLGAAASSYLLVAGACAARDGCRALPLQRRRHPPSAGAGRAQQLRALAGADDRL